MTTLKIAICEDEKSVSAEIEKTLKATTPCQIDVFYSGEAFAKSLNTGSHYDLIFLDIEYGKGEINGVDVGKLIRNAHQNTGVSIVFISWESKYSIMLHDMQPLNFLVKPIRPKDIAKVLKQHGNIRGVRGNYFVYKKKQESHRVLIKDIAYVESKGRKLILHMITGESLDFYGALKQAYQDQLQRFDFIQIHAAYAINYDHVANYSREEVTMLPHNTVLPIAQNKRPESAQSFMTVFNKRGE